MARYLLLALGAGAYVTDPIARHTACKVEANSPTVCILSGHVTAPSNGILDYYILSLPEEGLRPESRDNVYK